MATTPSDKGPNYDVHLVSALRELVPRLSIHQYRHGAAESKPPDDAMEGAARNLTVTAPADLLRASQRNASYPQQPPHKAVDKSDFYKRFRRFIRWLFLDRLFLESFQRSLAARASPKQKISPRSAVVAKNALTVHSGACALPVPPRRFPGLSKRLATRGTPAPRAASRLYSNAFPEDRLRSDPSVDESAGEPLPKRGRS
jgi:hypothetical protein